MSIVPVSNAHGINQWWSMKPRHQRPGSVHCETIPSLNKDCVNTNCNRKCNFTTSKRQSSEVLKPIVGTRRR